MKTQTRWLPTGLLAAGLLLAAATPARAVLKAVEQAYELAPSAVRVPTASDAPLTVFPCAKCRAVPLRVKATTAWYVTSPPGQATSQAEFLKALRAAGANPRALIYVYYEPRTRHVTRLVLDAPVAGVRP